MRQALPLSSALQGGPSGAPIAVPGDSDAPIARSRIDGYDQLDEATFVQLLDEVGPRGLGATVVRLLAGSTAATFLLGFLGYGLPLVTLLVVLTFVAAGDAGFAALDRRRRRRLVIDAALGLGFSERFATRVAHDLELMNRWLPREERTGLLGSWASEKQALVTALRRVKGG